MEKLLFLRIKLNAQKCDFEKKSNMNFLMNGPPAFRHVRLIFDIVVIFAKASDDSSHRKLSGKSNAKNECNSIIRMDKFVTHALLIAGITIY